jgi:hypothetical protein
MAKRREMVSRLIPVKPDRHLRPDSDIQRAMALGRLHLKAACLNVAK